MYILESDTLMLTQENIKDKIEFLQQSNPDTGDLLLGVAGMAQLTFTIYDLYNTLSNSDITSKIFTYSKAKNRIITNKWLDFKDVGAELMVLHEGKKYCIFGTSPYFKIIGDETITPTQPTLAVNSIYIKDNKVYLSHKDVDYMSVYSLLGVKQNNHTLTPFEQSKMKIGEMANRQGNVITQFYIEKQGENGAPSDYLEIATTYEQLGIFIANKPTRENNGNIKVVAHDNMSKFETVIDNWVNTILYPVTAYGLLQSLCSYIGITLATTSITNGNYSIIKKFAVENTTARTLLQWICELSANFAYFDSDGKLHVEFYKQSNKIFSPSNYKKTSVKEYTTSKIDKVQVKVQDDDIGVIVPLSTSGTNAYIIANNPLMYTSSDTELRPIVTEIYNKIKDFIYVPIEFETVLDNDFSANIGEIITLVTTTGEQIKSPVMVKRVVGSIETYTSTGNLVRSTQNNSLNQAIKMLNGRTSQLVDTVDEFSKTLTEVKSETETNTTQLKLTQGEILLKVDANGIISAINMSPEHIQIDTSKLDITGVVTIKDLETEGETIINGSNITTGIISADVIEASTARLKYLTIGEKSNKENVFPTRVFPNGVRWEDNSYLLSTVDDGTQQLTIASTGKQVVIGAEYKVVASSDSEGNPAFMVIPNPAIKVKKEFVEFLKPTNLVWRGTQTQYNALTAEQKAMYFVEVII